MKAGHSERMKKRLDAFEMKSLRKILRVSWSAKNTNEWVLNEAEVRRELLDTVKAKETSIPVLLPQFPWQVFLIGSSKVAYSAD